MASYIESVLASDEQLLYRARVSAWSLSGEWFLGLLLLPLGIGLLIWLSAFITYKSTELGITNKKIIVKFGFIKRETIELLLPRVESVRVHQSLFGRLFDFGSISISGAGNPQAPVPGIQAPLEFRRAFMVIQEKSSQ